MPREKSRHRVKRSSSYSSDSSYDRKKSKSKLRRRSKSSDRSKSSSRRRRSPSRTRHKRRSYSRSVSREKYGSRNRRRSLSKSKKSRRSETRNRSYSRSSSRERSIKKSHKSSNKRSRSSSKSSFFDIEPMSNKEKNNDDTETKIEKAIKAAEAAGLTMTKLPAYEYKEIDIKEDMPTIHDRNLLAEINSDSFSQKSFTSSKNKKQSQNIVIDLESQSVQLPEANVKIETEDSIIDLNALPNEEEFREMWIKKLYLYRKKILKGESY